MTKRIPRKDFVVVFASSHCAFVIAICTALVNGNKGKKTKESNGKTDNDALKNRINVHFPKYKLVVIETGPVIEEI